MTPSTNLAERGEMAQAMKLPRSARETEEEHLIGVLEELHEDDPEFGYRFLTDGLHDLGYRVSERRVWRLCRDAGIRSVITKRRARYRKALPLVHDDLVKRDFLAIVPNECWLTDITEQQTTREGKLCLCAVKDVWSNRIVGYAIGDRMKASLAVRALEDAVMQRGNPTNVVVHSDRGSQIGSKKYRRALNRDELLGSKGRVSAAGDNAAMESFFQFVGEERARPSIVGDAERTQARDCGVDRGEVSPETMSAWVRSADAGRV